MNDSLFFYLTSAGVQDSPDPNAEYIPEIITTALPLWVWLIIGALALIAVCVIVLRAHKRSRQVKKESFSSGQGIGQLLIANIHHIGTRDEQQDSFGVSDISDQSVIERRGILAVVADGMGGLQNGAQVSSIVTSTMLRNFSRSTLAADPAFTLLAMVEEANRAVCERPDNEAGSGSTVVAALIMDDNAYTISVGDSRIYLYRGGSLIQINREHIYANELDEQAVREQISMEEARSNKQRSALTSYIGMGELDKIDRTLRPLKMLPCDRILLMSDGVYGTLSDDELCAAMEGTPYQAVERVQEEILARGKQHQDNFTLIIMEYNKNNNKGGII